MGNKKKYRGHYCKVCNSVLPNERFSGKGHSNRICKKCSKLSKEEQSEKIELNKIYKFCSYMNLSKANRKILQNYLHNESERIRMAAKEVLDKCTQIQKISEMEREYEEITGLDSSYQYDEYLEDLRIEKEANDIEVDYFTVDGDEIPF